MESVVKEEQNTRRRTYSREAPNNMFEPTVSYLRKRIPHSEATRLDRFLCSHATRNATENVIMIRIHNKLRVLSNAR